MTNNNIHRIKRIFLIILTVSVSMIASSCKKPVVEEPVIETATVTDIEGNVYATIKIGNQWWMAENLKVKKYQDGTPVPLRKTGEEWATDSVGAYCEFEASFGATGLLYNWYAINNIKTLAPAGWRIPTDADWMELEKSIGMAEGEIGKTAWRGEKEGDKLKAADYPLLHWEEYGEVFANNESGFKALAGGFRMPDGTWGTNQAKRTTFFWSSTLQGNEVWYRYLDYQKSNIFRYHGRKNYGFSVRCVKIN